MKAKILQVKMTSKKGLACLLAVLMLLTALPLGLVTSAMAATKDCMVVEVQGKKVYFFGAEALEVTGSKVAYTAESAEVPTIYVDGAVDPADDVQISDGVIDFGTWLADQSAWVGVLCDPDGTVTGTEPSVQPDAQAPRVTVSGNPTAWGKAPAILTVQADDGNGYGAVAYRMDNGQWQKAPEFRVKANGTYTFYAKDAVGNVSTGETVEVQYVDATAPEIGVVLDPPNAGEQWSNDKVKVTVTGKDSESGLAEKAFKMDEGQWQETGTFVIQDNKEHNFYVRDAVGNEAKQQAKADKYDNIAPVIQKVQVKLGNLVLKQGTYISDQITYTYHIDATDNEGGSGIKFFSCNGGKTWQTSGDFKLKGGESYDFCVKDQAENESAVLPYVPNYDTTAPTINDVQQSTDKPTNQAVTVTVTANDVQSGLNKFGAYKLDNGDWQRENSFDIQDDKIHTVSVRDNANPENVAEKKIQVKNFNSTPPTVTNVTLSNAGADGKENWTNEPITATVEAKGNTNNAQVEFPVVAYKMDDGDWQYIEKSETANRFTIEDKKEHKFYCLDNAGNASSASSCAAKLYDKKAPELEPQKTPEFYPVEFSQSNNGPFAKFLNKLSFGRFFNKELKITVYATDGVDEYSNASGFSADKVQSLIFRDTNNQVVTTIPAKVTKSGEVGKAVSAEFTAEITAEELKNFKGSLYVQLQDQLGNQTEEIQVTTANSNLGELKNTEEFGDCNFVLENNAPRILAAGQNAELKAENAVSASPSTTIFKNDYTVSFHVSDQTDKDKDKISGVAGVQVSVNGTVVYSQPDNNENTDNNNKKMLETGIIDLHAVAKADDEKNAHQVNGVKIEDENWNGGELTYTVEAWDNAGNASKVSFTLNFDQTAPTVQFAIPSGNTCKKVTVTVTEHNFNAKAFENQLKATLNGKGIAVPSVSAFRQENGTDRWTATVTFVADGDYVLNFKTTDKAGNSYKTVAGDFSGAAAQDFTIDKTAPQLTIGGITTNTAYKKVPTIVAKEADNNASTITSSVVGTCFDSQSKMAKRTVKVSAKNSGQLTADHQLQNTVTYTAVEQDGYYIVTAQCVDMAGNQSQVQRKVFTKNEKGAVYVVSDDLAALNNGYANKTAVAKQSLVVTEYSPTEIQSPEYYININGKKKDGLVTMEKGQHHAGEWYVNTYTISSKDILAEGKYALYIKSTTKLDGKNTVVNNSSENKDLHRLNIQFTIDNTNPYVRITGLEKHLYSNTKVQTVTFSVSESNLASIVIHMTRDGQALDPLVWDHAQDKKHPNGWTVENGIAVVQVQLENGKSDLTFEITDLAGNKCSTANDYNKQELFVSGTTGNKNNWLEEKDGKIVLKDIYVDKGFSANAFAALIRNNLAISVVIFVVIGLVLLAVIILPILSKKRKKMDAADAEKLN